MTAIGTGAFHGLRYAVSDVIEPGRGYLDTNGLLWLNREDVDSGDQERLQGILVVRGDPDAPWRELSDLVEPWDFTNSKEPPP